MERLKPPYFDNSHLPNPDDAYVAWIDVMGVRGWMLRSLPITANFVCKLHAAALEEKRASVTLYPVMDGIYVVTPNKNDMRSFLSVVFERLAVLFNDCEENEHRVIVKASVAFGKVIHGSAIPTHSSRVFERNEGYKNTLLLGMPMIAAHQGEPSAPPFGVFVHESAGEYLTTDERKRSHCWWQWFCERKDEAVRLTIELPKYFSWCSERAGAIAYDPVRIRVHRAQADEYFKF